MIDEKRVIAKLEKRIDEFIKSHPDQKDGVSVQIIRELFTCWNWRLSMVKRRSDMANNHDIYDREVLKALQSIAKSLKVIANYVEARQTEEHISNTVNEIDKEE